MQSGNGFSHKKRMLYPNLKQREFPSMSVKHANFPSLGQNDEKLVQRFRWTTQFKIICLVLYILSHVKKFVAHTKLAIHILLLLGRFQPTRLI